jgi:hypothetical protein
MPDCLLFSRREPRARRGPTKLECGKLGALSATIALSILAWLSIQFSLVSLMVQIGSLRTGYCTRLATAECQTDRSVVER